MKFHLAYAVFFLFPQSVGAEILQLKCSSGPRDRPSLLAINASAQVLQFANWPAAKASYWGERFISWGSPQRAPGIGYGAFLFDRETSELMVEYVSPETMDNLRLKLKSGISNEKLYPPYKCIRSF